MNPFPHVELGGYTRYYQSRGLLADRSFSVASPDPVESKRMTRALPHSVSQRRLQKRVKPKAVITPTRKSRHSSVTPGLSSSASPAILSPGIDATISSSTASCSLDRHVSKSTLIVIPEESVASVATGTRRSSPRIKNISGGSLRRKRRILRMTSAEHDTLRNAYLSSIAGSLSYTLSGASAISHGSSMSSETRVNSPNATMASLVSNLGYYGTSKTTTSDDPADDSDEHYERPDSRLSFRTAKSDFGD